MCLPGKAHCAPCNTDGLQIACLGVGVAEAAGAGVAAPPRAPGVDRMRRAPSSQLGLRPCFPCVATGMLGNSSPGLSGCRLQHRGLLLGAGNLNVPHLFPPQEIELPEAPESIPTSTERCLVSILFLRAGTGVLECVPNCMR